MKTTRTPEQIEFIESAIALGKAEILHHVQQGVVPVTVRQFSELHDHVDANTYAGLCDEAPASLAKRDALFPGVEPEQELLGSAAWTDACNEIQNRLSSWIREGGLREQSAAVVYYAWMETRHFTFDGVAASQQAAVDVVASAIAAHSLQYGLGDDWWTLDDVGVRPMALGRGYRDGN